MNLEDYKKDVARTCSVMESLQLNNLHMVLGMITEIGELADVFKKNLAYKKDIDWVNVKEELGDLVWYITQFCNINDLSLEDVMETNSNKLHTRYPDRFTTDNALNRDLTTERSVLEGKLSGVSHLQIIDNSETDEFDTMIKNL
jgi:NTP pyrophosphatase (non-canonical NTP hydrolase)